MSKAGTREKQFIEFCNSIDYKLLSGKMTFENSEKVYVSVDNSIITDNEIILIEIDASNQAKLVSGQYTLLSLLKDRPSKKFKEVVRNRTLLFFVVHCYKNYNPERSKNNFEFINKCAFDKKGLKYGSIHINDLMTKEKLISIIKKNIC